MPLTLLAAGAILLLAAPTFAQGYPPSGYPQQGAYPPLPPPYPPPYPQGQPSPYPPQGYPQQGPYPPQQAPYPPPPPPYPPPPPPGRDDDPDAGKPGWNLDSEAFGGRFSTLGTSGSDSEKRTYGGSFASYGLSNYAGEWVTSRTTGRGVIGGGSGGFEGELSGTMALGVGHLIDGVQGPFLRVGVQGYILGNDSFFHSAIAFPQGSLGWHLGSREGYMLELGGSLGPMLDGRFDVGDQGRRRLGSSPAYGAYLDVFAKPATLTVEWQRVAAVSVPDTAVDSISGHVCLASGKDKKHYGVALCVDGRYTSGDVRLPTTPLAGAPSMSAGAGSTYLGFTLGFGFNAIRKAKN